MISLAEASSRILSCARLLGAEEVALDASLGRVLVEEIVARWDLPMADDSAMDGYALRSADTRGATPERPVRLQVVVRIHAGHEGRSDVRLQDGQAAYVATGAGIPAGADAVVRIEATDTEGDILLIGREVARGANIRVRGEDVAAGQPLVSAGTPIDPAVLGILASFGHARVPVARRPRVAVVPIGDELVAADAADGQRPVESNSHVLAAQAVDAGALASRHGIVRDDAAAVADAVRPLLDGCDVVVTVGSSSVGERDVAREAFDRLGVDVAFWKVAVKPGKPVGFGRLGRHLLFALPGNPAAATTTFELLVRPALRALMGAADVERPAVRGRLSAAVHKQPGPTYALRAHARVRTSLELEVPERQGSGRVGAGLGTNAIAMLPPGIGELAAGDEVDVQLLAPPRATPAVPLLCFVGPSGVGKTTLLTRLIRRLSIDGVVVGALKHDAHRFHMDHEGKDTWRFRDAGAYAIAIAAPAERAVITSTARPTGLTELAACLPSGLDLILVEGYKGAAAPKVEVHHCGLPPLTRAGATNVVALVTDDDQRDDVADRFGRDDIDGLLAFIRRFMDRPAAGQGGA